MNVGEYIRIDGYISKIEHMKTSSSGKIYVQWKQPNGLLASTNIKLIEKSSPQIIDLIECDDIVINRLGEIIRPTSSNIDELKDYWKICENPIKQILTHEQFESEAYRVEE